MNTDDILDMTVRDFLVTLGVHPAVFKGGKRAPGPVAARRASQPKSSSRMPEGGYVDAGLTADDVRRIAIATAIANGGSATLSEIYVAVDSAMQAHGGVRLSADYNVRARVRAAFNSKERNFLAYDKRADCWRVTNAGRNYVK